jgi:WD40 repeat protein
MRTFKVARCVYSLAYSPDSTELWVGDMLGRVHRWDLAAGTGRVAIQVEPGPHFSGVSSLSVSADGRLVAASSYGRMSVVSTDPSTPDPINPPEEGVPAGLCSVMAPNGELVAVAGGSGDVVIWDRPKHLTRRIGSRQHFASNLAFSPDSRLLAVGHIDAPIILFDPVRGEVDGSTLDLEQGSMGDIKFSPDGKLLATTYYNLVILWDLVTRQRVREIRAGQAFVRKVAFHPGGKLLATCGDIPTLSLWDVEGRSCGRFNWEISKVQALAFAPDGMTAAAGGSRGKVAVWDVEA